MENEAGHREGECREKEREEGTLYQLLTFAHTDSRIQVRIIDKPCENERSPLIFSFWATVLVNASSFLINFLTWQLEGVQLNQDKQNWIEFSKVF